MTHTDFGDKIDFIKKYAEKYNIPLPISATNLAQSNPSLLENIFQIILKKQIFVNQIPQLLKVLSNFIDPNFYDKLLYTKNDSNSFFSTITEELNYNLIEKITEDINNIKIAYNESNYTKIANSIYQCFLNILEGLSQCWVNMNKIHPESMIFVQGALAIISGSLLSSITPTIEFGKEIFYFSSLIFGQKKENAFEQNFSNFDNIINFVKSKDSRISQLEASYNAISSNLTNGLSSFVGLKLDSELVNDFAKRITESDSAKTLVNNVINMEKSFEDQTNYPIPLKNIINILPQSGQLVDMISEINKSDSPALDKIYRVYETISNIIDGDISKMTQKGMLEKIDFKKNLQENVSLLGKEFASKIVAPLKENKNLASCLGINNSIIAKMSSVFSLLTSSRNI